MISWIRQWLFVHRQIRGYKKVIRECKRINRQIDKILKKDGE